MGGYLINYFKYPPADLNTIKNNGALRNEIESENYSLVRNVVWSNLDRIEVRRIDDFRKFRSAEESEKNWIGERQFTLLYDLIDEQGAYLKYRSTHTKEDRCRFRFEPVMIGENENRDDFRFFGISMVSLSPLVHEYIFSQRDSRKILHDKIADVLKKLCKSESASFLDSRLRFEIYGTLSSADCVIIWLVNQYTDVIALVEALREIKCSENEYLISNVYTIMGLTNPLSNNAVFKGSKGLFNLRIIKRGGFNLDVLKGTLSDYIETIDDINIVLGKYDVNIIFASNAIKENIYKEGGPIHFRNEEYYKTILEAHTELMKKSETEYIKPISYPIKELENISAIVNEDISYTEIKDRIEKVIEADIFCDMPYLAETLWLLYQDYVKNTASEFSYPWSVDLRYSFQKSIDYLQEILQEQSDMEKSDVINYIQNFIESIRQTILHISQAGKLYFEIPNSHLKQTDSYSKVLRAYYGIIKQLLKIAYGISRISPQSEIIPFITFDVNPKAESEFCQSFVIKDKRVVNFKLPYEALTDVVKYSKLLAHEVYHYIAPERRDLRNFLFGCIFWTEILKDIFSCYSDSLFLKQKKCQQDISRWQSNCGSIRYILREEIWNSVIDNYDKLMGEYINKSDCLWSEYYNSLDNKVLKTYQDDKKNISIIATILGDIVKEKLPKQKRKSSIEPELKEVINALINDVDSDTFIENFYNWYYSSGVLNHVGVHAGDLVDACREACADYYMIQVTDMDVNEYIRTTLDFAYSFESHNNIHPMQKYRVGILLDYIWFSSKGKELENESLEQQVNALNLTEQQAESMEQIFDEYLKYGSVYRKVFFQLLNKIQIRGNKEIENNIKEFCEKVSQYFKGYKETDFNSNLSIIENMQNQQPLKHIYKRPQQIPQAMLDNIVPIESLKNGYKIKKAEKTEEGSNREILYACDRLNPVQTMEGFVDAFDQVSKDIRKADEVLWFRGHNSSKHKLVPSLYRLKNDMEPEKIRPLKQIMEDLTCAFRVRAYHTPEIFPNGNDTIIGTMVSMQHYGVNTNLLDWSQQLFSALYFALEDYINDPDKQSAKVNARVYIFNPARYNKEVESILNFKMNENYFVIPSIMGDDEKYARYLPILKSGDGVDGYVEYNYPIAIYTPYVNARIKAQAGCFTIFSLSVDNDQDREGHAYMRFDLQEIQEECKKKGGSNFSPFLSYIDIDKDSIPAIAKSVKAMGINKQNIYPELSNIGEEMKNEIKKYY